MNVLHLSHGCRPDMSGGVEAYLERLLAEQRRQGMEVHLLAGSHELRPETTIETQTIDGATVHRLYRDDFYFDHYAKAYHAKAEEKIEALIAELHPDVVHVHQWIRLTSNLVEIATRQGVPAVITTHDVYTSCPRCFRVRADDESCYRSLSPESCTDCVPRFGHESERELEFGIQLHHDQYRKELDMASRVLVSDMATAELIAATTDTTLDRFHELPLPYDRIFAGAPAPAPVVDDEPIRFAYWGVLTYRKGAQFMARAFAQLCDEGLPRPAELHLFGGIDTTILEQEMHSITKGLPVVFHGRYEYEQLANAKLHAGIFPMLCFETWGFVLDECFELGLPCITTENGALSRRAGEAAVRVPQKSTESLKDAMRNILRRPAMLDELRRKIPPLPPTTAEHTERLRDVYADAIATGPSTVAPIPAWRRARFIELQRESALGRVMPPEGPR